MIRLRSRGSSKAFEAFAQRIKARSELTLLNKYGAMGVAALSQATPKESAETANSWTYEIVNKSGYYAIHWSNTHHDTDGDSPVAILLQYGHATRGGGHVEGRDYINPAIRPIFDQMASDFWKEVTR